MRLSAAWFSASDDGGSGRTSGTSSSGWCQCSSIEHREGRGDRSTRRTWMLADVLDTLLTGDGLPRALAGPGIGPRALAADRQSLAVPQPAVAADVAQAGDVLLDLAV